MGAANTERSNHLFFAKYLSDLLRVWKVALNDRTFRLKLLLAPGIFVVYAAITQPLCNFVQLRKGIQLDDKLLSLLPVVDFSIPIFCVLYGSMAMVLAAHVDKPRIIMRLLEMQILMAVARQICILLIPLEPPVHLVLLRDVFLENTFYPHQVPMTKDLFFSGHVANIWIFFLCTQGRNLKAFFGVATLLMSFMLLSMRVHYTYDVYGAIAIITIIHSSVYRTRRKRIKEAYLWVKDIPNRATAR